MKHGVPVLRAKEILSKRSLVGVDAHRTSKGKPGTADQIELSGMTPEILAVCARLKTSGKMGTL